MEWFIHHLLYFIPLGALLLDTLVGDPRSKYHPVVLIGNCISFYEHLLYKKEYNSKESNTIRDIYCITSLNDCDGHCYRAPIYRRDHTSNRLFHSILIVPIHCH